MRKPLVALIATLFITAALTPAQDGAAPAEQPAKNPNAFTDAEVEKLAQQIGKLLDSDKLKQRERLRSSIEKTLDGIRESGRDPIKAVDSWTRVYTHPKLKKRGGRAGRKLNVNVEVPLALGRQAEVIYHTIAPKDYRGKEPVASVICLHPLDGKMDAKGFLREFYESKDVQERALLFAPEAPGFGKSKKESDSPGAFAWSKRSKLYRSFGVLGAFVAEDYLLDRNAIFLDGYGDAAVDVWRLYSQLGTMFAGVIIRGALPPAETRFEDFKNAKVLLVGVPEADLDPAKADEVAAKLKAAGCTDVTVVKLNEAPRSRKERESFMQMDAALAAFLEKRRDAYPTSLDWSIKETHTRRSYWLASGSSGEVEASTLEGEAAKKPPTFTATIDRAKNRIAVKTHRLTQLVFRLSHKLLDLDKDITIEVNGKVLFTGKAEPTLFALRQDNQPSDPTQLYSWVTAVTLPIEMYAPKKEKKDDSAAGGDKKQPDPDDKPK